VSIRGVVLAHPRAPAIWSASCTTQRTTSTSPPSQRKRVLRRLLGEPTQPDARILRGIYGLLEQRD